MIAVLMAVVAACPGQLLPGGKSEAVESEVRRNLLAQPCGPVTVEALELDPQFVDRVVDRIVRLSYRERYRAVAADTAGDSPVQTSTPLPDRVAVINTTWPKDLLQQRVMIQPERPALRGFQAPIMGMQLPGTGDPEILELVARRLARDGLLQTLAEIVERRGAAWVRQDAGREHLRAVGYPVDLLEYFGAGSTATIDAICAAVEAADSAVIAGEELRKRVPFRWRPTLKGFSAASESGERPIGELRLQATRSTVWRSPGAGGILDIQRQLLAIVPDRPCTFTVKSRDLSTFKQALAAWSPTHPGPVRVFTTVLPLTHWARDNGQAGLTRDPTGRAQIAVLLPRYANQREESSFFMPNESFLMNDLAEHGLPTGHSPLLFQGGNIITARHPGTGQRIGFIGEAEIFRNMTLGLDRAQVEHALASELNVDRVVVLPALGIHIDTEVTFRSVQDRLIAFVNDPQSAARTIVASGLTALEQAGVITSSDLSTWTKTLQSGEPATEVARNVEACLQPHRDSQGRFPASLASRWSSGPADSGPGNLALFLTALETLDMDREASSAMDRHEAAHLRALLRQRALRPVFQAVLEAAGCVVVTVPGMSDYKRGVNYLNGLHEPARYLMPTWGGLYAPLDAAAAAVFRDTCGSTLKVVGILSAESQRQGGALHCAAMVWPLPREM